MYDAVFLKKGLVVLTGFDDELAVIVKDIDPATSSKPRERTDSSARCTPKMAVADEIFKGIIIIVFETLAV